VPGNGHAGFGERPGETTPGAILEPRPRPTQPRKTSPVARMTEQSRAITAQDVVSDPWDIRRAQERRWVAILTDLVTNGGGHSRTSHDIVFAVAITLLAGAAILLMLGQGASRRRAETHPAETNQDA
jgi:hypothetical protein